MLNLACQIPRISRLADEAGNTFKDVLGKGSNICCDYRQAIRVCKEENPTLKDLGIRQDGDIRSLEVDFCLGVRNELDLLQNLQPAGIGVDLLLNRLPVALVALLAFACDYKPVIVLPGDLVKRLTRYSSPLYPLMAPK